MQSASISQIARSSYETGPSLKNTSVIERIQPLGQRSRRKRLSPLGAVPAVREHEHQPRTGAALGRFHRCGHGRRGSSQFQMPPFHSTTWASSLISG